MTAWAHSGFKATGLSHPGRRTQRRVTSQPAPGPGEWTIEQKADLGWEPCKLR